MPISDGTRLGRYEVRSPLGAGGMGEVYLAQDTKLDRKVALKILPAEVAAHRDRMRRFIQEAKAASSLNHPNIITIHEIDETDSINFIATEFIDGETLRERMRTAPMKLGEVLDVAAQIASALSAAHAAGIVHRDIKPENIMLRRDGIVKVLDFGLAKLTERVPPDSVDSEAPTSFKTDPGTVMGTAVYMSPEQARGIPVDARTDIFSLGVVLYEMVAGCLPFEGSTSSEVLASILSERGPQPLVRYSRDVPAELERIVSKVLRKNRAERYQTIKDLLLDLQSLNQELEFERKLERSAQPQSKGAAGTGEQAADGTVMGTAAHPTVSEKTSTSALMLNQRNIVLAVAALLIIASVVVAYFYFARARRAAIESIAVMPFVNSSGNSDMEYLSDGKTDMLISSLSQLPRLSVKARSSVFRYKGKDASPQQVGKELNVQAILNGRVVQRGNDLTLHIELVDAQTETALWSGDYNRSMTNLATLQGEIARDVSRKLRARLSGAEEQKVARNYTDNAEAYQLYLKGRYHYLRLTRPEIDKAIDYYQQAIALDQSYALAYTGLSAAYRSLALTSDVPSNETLPKAKAAALRALEIDESLAEAHAALGIVAFWYDWDWKAAEKHFLRALELDPDGTAHAGYSQLLSDMGQHEKALIEAKRARELEPLNLRNNAGEGQALFFAGRYDESIDRLQKTIELDPNFWLSHLFLSRVYIEKKIYAEAVAEATKAKDLSGGNSEAVAHVVYALAKAGKQEEARRTLDELKKRAAVSYVPPYAFALSCNGLGETDQAIAWLVKGLEQREVKMTLLTVDPKWNNLRSDPRFQDLLRRMGLPQ